MRLRHIALAALALTCNAPSHAIPFDTTSSSTQATATVGPGGDYATLVAASAAFSALASVNRPWVLLIQGNLTETAGCYFGATFGTNGSLTIRPATGTTPTITFTNTNNPTGWDGHLVLGAKNGTVITGASSPQSSLKFTIDGSATVGGRTRDLLIRVGTPASPIASSSEMVVAVVGATDGAMIRNLRVAMHDTGGVSAAIGLVAVQLGGNSLAPDVATIRNCELTVTSTTGGNASGVFATEVSGGGLASGTAMQGLTVEDCTISAPTVGIQLLATGDSMIRRNTITVSGGITTPASYAGILHLDANDNLGFVGTISRNTIGVSAPSNSSGILMTPGGTSAGTYVVENNAIHQVAITGLTTPTAVDKRGIFGSSSTCSWVIEHNSVRIDDQPNVSITGPTRVCGIGLSEALSAPNTIAVRNNIVRNAQTGFGSTALYYGWHSGVTSEGNCLWPTDAVGWVSSSRYASLTAWRAGGMPVGFLGFDKQGQSADPQATTPAWNATLRFATKPVAGLGTVPSSSYVTDIDGHARPGSGALPGSSEPLVLTMVQDWRDR